MDISSDLDTLTPSQIYGQDGSEVGLYKIQAFVSSLDRDYMSGDKITLSDSIRLDNKSLTLELMNSDNIKVGDELILFGVTEIDRITGGIAIKGWVQP